MAEALTKMKKIAPRAGSLIAITGNIASGKTFVTKILNKQGFAIFAFDNFAKNLLVDNLDVRNKLFKHFPHLFHNGDIDRKGLRDKIFSDKKSLGIVEKIIHVHTLRKIVELRRKTAEGGRSVIVESALIFEKRREKYFDAIINVVSPHQLKLERVQRQGKINVKTFLSILKLQLPFSQTSHRSDFTIYNFARLHTIKSIKKIIHYGH
jgi:dephospho-CoA kinase